HYSNVGRRQGLCLAATGSWPPCSRRLADAELRRLKAASLLGPASGRSALRKNRRVARSTANTIATRMLYPPAYGRFRHGVACHTERGTAHRSAATAPRDPPPTPTP